MVAQIPEVDLGVDSKFKNIERTERMRLQSMGGKVSLKPAEAADEAGDDILIKSRTNFTGVYTPKECVLPCAHCPRQP